MCGTVKHKIIAIVGKSGSGKTTLIHFLIKKYGDEFKKVVTYTTRPFRKGEIDGLDYHFCAVDFGDLKKDLVITKKTSEGYCFGTRRQDLTAQDTHLLLDIRSVDLPQLLDLSLRNVVVIFLSIDDASRLERMKRRGDSPEYIERRLLCDKESDVYVELNGVKSFTLKSSSPVEVVAESVVKIARGEQ